MARGRIETTTKGETISTNLFKHENLMKYVEKWLDSPREFWKKKSHKMRSYQMFLARYCWHQRPPPLPPPKDDPDTEGFGGSWDSIQLGDESENLPMLVNRLIAMVTRLDRETRTEGCQDEDDDDDDDDDNEYTGKRYRDTLELCALWLGQYTEIHSSYFCGLQMLTDPIEAPREDTLEIDEYDPQQETRQSIIDILTAALALRQPSVVRAALCHPSLANATYVPWKLAVPLRGALQGQDFALMREFLDSAVSPLSFDHSFEVGSGNNAASRDDSNSNSNSNSNSSSSSSSRSRSDNVEIGGASWSGVSAAVAIANGTPDAVMAMLTHPKLIARGRLNPKMVVAAREAGCRDIVEFCEARERALEKAERSGKGAAAVLDWAGAEWPSKSCQLYPGHTPLV
ncbi:hypothetical protein MKZ38_002384 [Zalerion maritima]|uniref:Uncharacterized protein n=1 Tax=Zalerion maritima TaxID=339359 RepID=A0AAD5RFX1_9PEZI|nr:hypothetical protein MKZ38_002384 [Zalerion maritima]